jgi:hypothetical protein
MAFSTYTELKSSIIAWSHRNDIDLLIPDFIALAEKAMYNPPKIPGRAIEPLKLKQLEKTATASTSITSRFIATPDDFASLRNSRLVITDESGFMDYRTPAQLNRVDTANRPLFFTVIGTQIEFDRISDQVYTVELQYFSSDTKLTAAAPTNLVLTNHPELYLYGALVQAFIYAGDDENATKYQALFIGALTGANNADRAGRFGSNIVTRVEGSTP